MIKYLCDGCGKEVTEDTGVINMKELTLEFSERKVSIAVELDTTDKRSLSSAEHPAVCAECIAARFRKWADMVDEA